VVELVNDTSECCKLCGVCTLVIATVLNCMDGMDEESEIQFFFVFFYCHRRERSASEEPYYSFTQDSWK